MGITQRFTLADRQELRRLAERAYEVEARALLEPLEQAFLQWRTGRLPSVELMALINDFHRNELRALMMRYDGPFYETMTARGIAKGFLNRSEVPPDLLAKLEPYLAAQRG